ncbi:sporulation protein [Streptomyces sp. WAC00288]|uniref:sporulation protein n=1 Tax=Streptomyces sp. WAC00288 TaxID=2094021 RepID=UPI00131BA754|nr:sporulation protein [Streptomyces sp. WAC00288]
MVFKRLLGSGSGGKAADGIPLEADTLLPDEPVRPGEILRGEVVLRAPDRDVRIRTVNARLVANAAPASVTKSTTTDVDTDTGVTLAHFQVTSLFTIPKGEERRVPLRYRLKWETPVSEVRGLPLAGMRIGLYTEVDADGIADRTDVDAVRIETTPCTKPSSTPSPPPDTPATARGSTPSTFRVLSGRSSTADRGSISPQPTRATQGTWNCTSTPTR